MALTAAGTTDVGMRIPKCLPIVCTSPRSKLSRPPASHPPPTHQGPRDLVAAVEDCGFGAEALAPGASASSPSAALEQELAGLRRDFYQSVAFTLPVFVVAMVLPWIPGTQKFREVRPGPGCRGGQTIDGWALRRRHTGCLSVRRASCLHHAQQDVGERRARP